MKFKSLPYRFLAMIISMLPLVAWPQTNAIAWSSFGGGFSVSASATTQLISLTGIPLISSATGPSTVIKSGFLAGLLVPSSVNAINSLTGVPLEFALHQNYPNPFNPETTLGFALPKATRISLVIYDIGGREISKLIDESMGAGHYQIQWDGKSSYGETVPSGVYIAVLSTREYVNSIKLVLMK